MEVIIESMTGSLTRLSVNPLETVRGLKTRIWKQEGVPLSQQSLVYKDRELDDSRQLQDYNINNGSTVKLVLITRSGPLNFRSPPDNEISMSSIVDFLRNVSLPSTSSGLVVLREGSQLNLYHFVDQTKQRNDENMETENTSTMIPAGVSNDSSGKIESRRASAAKRAEENYRTMQRMRELRHSMERLNLERSRRRQGEDLSQQYHDEATNSRQRRPSGSTAVVNARMKSSKTFPISNAFIVSNAKNVPHFLSAAEDTSAKESSAGETEFEDCHPVYHLPPLLHNDDFEQSGQQQASNNCCAKSTSSSATKTPFDHILPGDNVSCATSSRHVCSKRDSLSKTLRHNRMSSSCSDLEPDSSVLVSSDYDGIATSDQDQELYTADDGWSFEENDAQNNFDICDDDDEEHEALYNSDYQDALCSEEPGTEFPILNSKSLTTFVGNDKHSATETNASDPSELSSGAIVCDLAMNNRRSKVRRKYFNQRQFSKRPQQQMSCRAPIDESAEEQSSAWELSVGSSFRPNNGVWQDFATRPRAAVHQLRFGGPRRARSKPRLNAATAKTVIVSTGESSSDERDAGRDEPLLDKTRQANSSIAKTSVVVNSTWKQKPQTGSRQIPASKKMTSLDRCRVGQATPSNCVVPNYLIGAPLYSTAAACGSSPGVAPPVVRNHKLPQSSQSQQRCSVCSCRLSLATTFQCRCGKTVCPRHRNSDSHSCSYNELRRDAVGVTADSRKQSAAEHLPKL